MVEQRTYQIIQLSIYPRHWFSVTCPLELDNCREGNGNPLQYSCLENPMDEGAWWAEVHGVAKSRTWLSHFTLTFHFPALEKKMAAHSSVLAWRIPGTWEPGGLPSMGLLSQTWLRDFTFTFHFHALEKKMATHSSVLAWRIPGMG